MNYGETRVLFSDALERAYSQAAMDTSDSISIRDTLGAAGRMIKRGLSRFARFSADVINAQAEARARCIRYHGGYW